MSLRFSYKVGIFHVLFLFFFSYKFGLAIRITPSILGKHSDFFLFGLFIFLPARDSKQSRTVLLSSEIACLASVLSIFDFVLFKHWMLLEHTF